MAYLIRFAEPVRGHLRALAVGEQRAVLRAIETNLLHEPLRETRQRKPLRPNPIAPWELRIGHLRVFYDVEVGPEPRVMVMAVGVKHRNTLRIGGEEVVW